MTASQNQRRRPVTDASVDRAPDPAPETPSQSGGRARVPRTRFGRLWIIGVVFALVLLFLMIFILENGERADVSFLGAHWHLPLGIALLLSAIAGVLLIALPGSARILQLRSLSRRRAAGEPHTPAAEPATPPLDPDPVDDVTVPPPSQQ